MKKFVSTIVFIATAYALPLIGNPALILDWRIIALMLAGAVMLLSQPALTFRDASAHKDNDRLSVLLILGAGVVCQILPVIEWAHVRQLSEVTPNTIAIVVGLSMLIGGLTFRIWSIRTLGKFFTATVQRVEGHRVIKHGLYAIVRHLSGYLGFYVAMLGSAVLLEAYFSVVIGAVTIWLVYQWPHSLRRTAPGARVRRRVPAIHGVDKPALIPAVLGRRMAKAWRRYIAKLSGLIS